MKVAIMQPYLFPYIGYFQLIHAIDTFVFLDDVNFIKRGWINRNKILINNSDVIFTIPLKKASQNKLINEIEVKIDNKWLNQFYKTLEQNYKKAPNFKKILELVQTVFNSKYYSISDLAILSIEHVCNYLSLDRDFKVSSKSYPETKGQEKVLRLINISKQNKSKCYINPKGGELLYDKDFFQLNDVRLYFIDNELIPYKQLNNTFVSNLSIIDVLMFNDKETVHNLLQQYKLN